MTSVPNQRLLVNVAEFEEFPGEVSCCPVARQLVREALEGFPHAVDGAELAVSELFANAVAHTRSGEGGRVVLSLCGMATGLVLVSVTDQGPKLADLRAGRRSFPEVRPVDTDTPGFRGLRLVASCSAEWGYWPDVAGRLTVWAVFQPPAGVPRQRQDEAPDLLG